MMLSRVADSLYWMARYLERADHNARAIGVNLELSFDRTPEAAARHWGRLVTRLLPGPPTASKPEVPGDAWGDLSSRDAIVSAIACARENARQIREQLSSEMWERINMLHLKVMTPYDDFEFSARPHEFFRDVLEGVERFYGAAGSTMSRGQGWHFMQLGRYIERGAATARLLDGYFDDDEAQWGVPVPLAEYLEWSGLLRSCCAFEAYCRRYTAELRPDRVAGFLLLDPHCPRTVRFACHEVAAAADALVDWHPSRPAERLREAAREMCALLTTTERAELDHDDLRVHLAAVNRWSVGVHAALYDAYVTYPVDQALAMTWRGDPL